MNFALNSNFAAHRWRCNHLQHHDRLDVVALALKKPFKGPRHESKVAGRKGAEQNFLKHGGVIDYPSTPPPNPGWIACVLPGQDDSDLLFDIKMSTLSRSNTFSEFNEMKRKFHGF